MSSMLHSDADHDGALALQLLLHWLQRLQRLLLMHHQLLMLIMI